MSDRESQGGWMGLQEGFSSMWRRKADGSFVTRPAICGFCKREFTQRQVNKKFVEKTLLTAGAVEGFKKVSPEGYLPAYCIPCERKDLQSGHKVPWTAYPESNIWP